MNSHTEVFHEEKLPNGSVLRSPADRWRHPGRSVDGAIVLDLNWQAARFREGAAMAETARGWSPREVRRFVFLPLSDALPPPPELLTPSDPTITVRVIPFGEHATIPTHFRDGIQRVEGGAIAGGLAPQLLRVVGDSPASPRLHPAIDPAVAPRVAPNAAPDAGRAARLLARAAKAGAA
jgi:hypothetical protein